MRCHFLIIFLGTLCITSFAQDNDLSEKKVIIIRLRSGINRSKIKVNINRYFENDTIYLSELQVNAAVKNIFPEEIRKYYANEMLPVRLELFYESIDGKELNSLFQDLYDWIKEIKSHATNSGRDYKNTHIIDESLPAKIIVKDSYILVKDQIMDIPFYCPINVRKITKLERRIIKYIKSHNIKLIE